MIVFSVDYRLAPEHVFPAAYDDSVAVADYVLRNHERLGVDARRVLVGGDSAGGNLAAAVAARFKKRLRAQLLIYPMLQAFDFRLPAFVDNSEPFVLSPQKIVKCWLMYGNLSVDYEPTFLANRHLADDVRAMHVSRVHSDLIPSRLGVTNRTSVPAPPGDTAVSDAVSSVVLDPRYAPLMADSLDDHPDAYVVTAQHDVLRDDGLMYAQRLSEARNVRVQLKHYKDGFHGFIALSDSSHAASLPQAVIAVDEMFAYLESIINSEELLMT